MRTSEPRKGRKQNCREGICVSTEGLEESWPMEEAQNT